MTLGWLGVTLIIMALWGLWGFFSKLAVIGGAWKTVVIVQGLSQGALYMIALLALRPQWSGLSGRSITYAILAGVAGPAGSALFYLALTRVKQATVLVSLTAIYPLFTALLIMLVLHERVTAVQALGIVFAVTAIVLLSL